MNSAKIYIFIAAVLCVLITVCWSVEQQLPERYIESFETEDGTPLQFEMVLIEGGRFLMGSAEEEPGREEDEGPRHEVQVNGFYLCTYP